MKTFTRRIAPLTLAVGLAFGATACADGDSETDAGEEIEDGASEVTEEVSEAGSEAEEEMSEAESEMEEEMSEEDAEE